MKKFSLLFAFLISLNTYADTSSQMIERIQVENGQVYIYSKGFINTKNCQKADRVKLDKDSLGFKEMYSMALTAYTAKTPIGFWIKECGISPWRITVPVAYASYLAQK